MAITTCTACGKRVSTIIDHCSHCGEQLAEAQPEKRPSLLSDMAFHYISVSILLVTAGWLWAEQIGGSHQRPGLVTIVLFAVAAAWYGAICLVKFFRRIRRMQE